jgi:hypothetical protein
MAYEINAYSVKITLVAAADFSTSGQYLLVKLDSNGKAALCSAATDRPIGVLQNAVKSAGEAQVLLVGGTKLIAGGTIAIGDPLTVNSSGQAVKATIGTDTTKYVIGTALTGGASGEIITAVISAPAVARGA